MTRRQAFALAAAAVCLLAAPLIVGAYGISVLIVVLFSAYVGQAWNVMMGFAGQLSIGHALYFGLGAYAGAALFVHFGVPPWIGMVAGAVLAAAAGAMIGALGFRFGVQGVYFALLTIAFAEFTRILFDHFTWVGGTAGFFLPVENRAVSDLVNLRGSRVMFYYVLLAFNVAALLLCRHLLRRRIGYQWLAIRENPEAAEALGINIFRARIAAVAVSAAMTAIAGVLYAFHNDNLYPEHVFPIGRSVEIMLAPIIGGLGTLIGPIVGAFVLTALSEALTSATELVRFDGAKQFLYGLLLLVILTLRPSGIWPWLRARLRLA